MGKDKSKTRTPSSPSSSSSSSFSSTASSPSMKENDIPPPSSSPPSKGDISSPSKANAAPPPSLLTPKGIQVFSPPPPKEGTIPPPKYTDIPPPTTPPPSPSNKNAAVPSLSTIAQLPYSAHSKPSKKGLHFRSRSVLESVPSSPSHSKESHDEDKYSIQAIVSPRQEPNDKKSKKKDDEDSSNPLRKWKKSRSTTPMGSPQMQPGDEAYSPSTSPSMSKAGRILSKMLTKKRAATVADIRVTEDFGNGEEREAPSFLTTFYTPELRESLEEFLKKRFVHENIEFINDCNSFAEADFESKSAMAEEAQRIYNRYIAEGSPMEINIGYKERSDLKDDVFSNLDQGVFEKTSRNIRDGIETSFFLEWKLTGAWKTIRFAPIKLRPPTMTRVIENKRLWNQLIRFVSRSEEGKKYAEFYRKAELLRVSPSVLGLGVLYSFYEEFFDEPATDKQREVVPHLEKAMKNFYVMLERKYYPNWVLQKEWDCVSETHIVC